VKHSESFATQLKHGSGSGSAIVGGSSVKAMAVIQHEVSIKESTVLSTSESMQDCFDAFSARKQMRRTVFVRIENPNDLESDVRLSRRAITGPRTKAAVALQGPCKEPNGNGNPKKAKELVPFSYRGPEQI